MSSGTEATSKNGNIESDLILIDIGANLCHACFRNDLHEVIDYAQREAGVRRYIATTTSLKRHIVLRNFELCDKYPGVVSCTLGIHPHNAASEFTGNLDAFQKRMRELLREGGDKVVAVGETGLDYYRMKASPKVQLACFDAHVEMACETGKPLFLHERDAHADFLDVLDKYMIDVPVADKPGETIKRLPVPAVVHCFTGTAAQCKSYLDRGFYVGLTGYVAIKARGRHLREALASGQIPLDRLMVETNCPYMIPDGTQGMLVDVSRNESVTLRDTVNTIAKAMNKTPREVADATSQNARIVFNIQ